MPNIQKQQKERNERRRARVRAKIYGTTERPRASIFRSAKHINIQIIDDTVGKTLVAANSKEIKDKKLKPIELSKAVGTLVAQRAAEVKIVDIVFDRGRYKYHGRVKSLAEGMREGGLKF